MIEQSKRNILIVFFGLSACSWMPHWACHYYRLETGSSFVVGSWSFSSTDSYVSLAIYSLLIANNLLSIAFITLRISASLLSGLLHLTIGSIHLYRLWHPFPFEVFGYTWSHSASLRETAIVVPFGVLCIYVATDLLFKKS
jgi:hypothetical protein